MRDFEVNSMKIDLMKTVGYVVYAVGIVGCFEGVFRESIPISLAAMIIVIIGSVFLSIKPNSRRK